MLIIQITTMPRDDLRKILLLGSGPIVIGQSEFDYSVPKPVKHSAKKAMRWCWSTPTCYIMTDLKQPTAPTLSRTPELVEK